MKPYDICVIGTGYVGLVTGTCLAELGHRVVCVDSVKAKIKMLKAGRCPIHEPGLEILMRKNAKAGRLSFAGSIAQGMRTGGRAAQVVFIAVGTPPRPDGSADLSAVEAVAAEVAACMRGYTVIVDKSTVPVETGEWVAKTVARSNPRKVPFDVASNPEFLSEGSAVQDFLKPDRIVLGVSSARAEALLREVYAPLKATVLVTDVKSAELIKHASNSFLATKISFINAVSRVCEAVGADVEQVAKGMGLDRRIGPSFLRAGLGFGGFCLHPEEPVLTRDPSGGIRLLPISLLYSETKSSEGVWEALSLDPERNTLRFQPISAVSRRPYHGKLARLKTKMGKETTVTEDHPVLAGSGDGRWELKPASAVSSSDWMPMFLSVPSTPRHLRVDLIDSLKAARPEFISKIKIRRRGGKPWSLSAEAREVLRRLTRPGSSRAHDIAARGNPISFEEWLNLEKRGLPPCSHEEIELGTAKDRATYIPALIELTDSFCRLLGYLAAEGCIGREKSARGIRERAVFHFHESEKEFLDDVEGELRRLGIRFTRFHAARDHVRRILVSSRIFAYLVRDILGCGTDSYSACVPDAVLSGPDSTKMAFMEGAWRGDGSVSYPSHSPSVTLEFGTVSSRMALGMTSLAHSLGLVPSRKVAWQNKSTQPAHFLRISGARQVRAFRRAKGAVHEARILKRLSELNREIAPTGYGLISRQVGAVRVVENETIPYEGLVYSLEVAEHETFATGSGLILHNCFPKDLEAFYWISKKKGYDFQLLKAVAEVNDTQKSWIARKVEEELWNPGGKRVAVLGLAFKPNTDDLRFAPSLDIIAKLKESGVKLSVHDPVAMPKAKELLKGVEFAKDPYAALKGADCLALVTEWPEYKNLDFRRIRSLMRNPLVLDGRNFLDPAPLRALGFQVRSVGRP